MKIVVCGIGNLGHRVVDLLTALGERVTVVSIDGAAPPLRRLETACRIVIGDAREDAVLREAGVAEADALMALTGDDLVNLETAIMARDLNPRMVIVTRMFDDMLSSKIQSGFHIQKALSASHLAVPSFIAAAQNEAVLFSFDCGERRNHIMELTLDAASPLAGRSIVEAERAFGMHVVLRHRPGAGALHDDVLHAGDRVMISSFDRHVAERCTGRAAGARRTDRGARRRFSLRRVPRNVRIVILSYCALLAVAVTVFSQGMGITPVDALYFTVTTTTTVGYGDFNLQNAPVWLKLFGSLVMLSGAAVLAALFSLMTDTIISRRFSQFFGMGTGRVRDHIVVVGLGNIGYRVVNLLHEAGERIVAVERNTESQFLTALRGRIPVIFGNALHAATMEQAGVARARALLALTDDDLANLNIVLNAREAAPALHTVARIFNAGIGDRARTTFGIPVVLSTSAIAAPAFVGALVTGDTVYAFTRHGEVYLVVAMAAAQCNAFTGMVSADVEAQHDLHPFLVREDGRWELLAPGRSCRDGDEFMVLGRYADFKRHFGIG